jgi:hypothetical protein
LLRELAASPHWVWVGGRLGGAPIRRNNGFGNGSGLVVLAMAYVHCGLVVGWLRVPDRD